MYKYNVGLAQTRRGNLAREKCYKKETYWYYSALVLIVVLFVLMVCK